MEREIVCADFDGWREAALTLLSQHVKPQAIQWRRPAEEADLFSPRVESDENGSAGKIMGRKPRLKLPRAFVDRARKVGAHRAEDTWSLLYRMLWRLTRGERALMQNRLDEDVICFERRASEVHRAAHKMKAFLRFKRMPSSEEYWLGWFDPAHRVLPLVTPFFGRRFPNADWSILTPELSAHHRSGTIEFGPGQAQAPDLDDTTEALWLQYYRSTFNPARLNRALMLREMPRQYWNAMPETRLISELEQNASAQVHAFGQRRLQTPDANRERSQQLRIFQDQRRGNGAESKGRHTLEHSEPSSVIPAVSDWHDLEAGIRHCDRCPLASSGTKGVPGGGNRQARIMIVGEQPGDQEDLQGRPFVGPAGQLLRQALIELKVRVEDLYLTNAVKHFKFTIKGQRRLHATPSARDVAACAHWLDEEMQQVQPEFIIALGRSAGRRILGQRFDLAALRGRLLQRGATQILVTWHPAWLLRLPKSQQEEKFREWVSDLHLVFEAAELSDQS